MSFVYGLKCPVTSEIRYIGSTARQPSERLTQHIASPAKSMRLWIDELKARKLKPILLILHQNDNHGIILKLEYDEIQANSSTILNSTYNRTVTKELAWLFPDMCANFAHRESPHVTPGYDWLKWWRIKVNDEHGPFHDYSTMKRVAQR